MSTTNEDIAIFTLSIRFPNKLFLPKRPYPQIPNKSADKDFYTYIIQKETISLQYRQQQLGDLRRNET